MGGYKVSYVYLKQFDLHNFLKISSEVIQNQSFLN